MVYRCNCTSIFIASKGIAKPLRPLAPRSRGTVHMRPSVHRQQACQNECNRYRRGNHTKKPKHPMRNVTISMTTNPKYIPQRAFAQWTHGTHNYACDYAPAHNVSPLNLNPSCMCSICPQFYGIVSAAVRLSRSCLEVLHNLLNLNPWHVSHRLLNHDPRNLPRKPFDDNLWHRHDLLDCLHLWENCSCNFFNHDLWQRHDKFLDRHLRN